MRTNVPHSLAKIVTVQANFAESIQYVPELTFLEIFSGSCSFLDEFSQIGGVLLVFNLF